MRKPSFKIAFFDIDGTLHDHKNHCFVESGVKAIKEAKRNGVKVFICSARPYYSIKGFGLFDLGIKWDGYIASCGALAKVGRNYVKKTLFTKEQVRRIICSAKKRNLTMEVVTPYKASLIAEPNFYSIEYHKKFRDVDLPVKKYRGSKSTSVLLFTPREYDDDLHKENPDVVFYRFHDYGVDVIPSLHKKGEAINAILSYYGYQKEDAIGFGDGVQDISMKEGCKEFVAMGNADDEVKKAGTYITDSVDKDGLAKAMQHFGLINKDQNH